ncbi:MAG: SprT family zinc-dependent metalloprotease [Pseudomonadota bacterium]
MAQAVLETIVEWDGGAAPLAVQVNRRAKRIILRLEETTGRVIATAPSRSLAPEAVRFAKKNTAWIERQLAGTKRPRAFSAGHVFPFLGAPTRIINEGGARARLHLENGQLTVGGAPEHVNRRVTDWLKQNARTELTARADDYAARLDARRGPVRIKDMRSRWGSCASDGAIAFSWRIIMAPPAIVDYVAAHECAHLIHLNHSPAFWRLVADLDVDAHAARRWFRQHGSSLFLWGG